MGIFKFGGPSAAAVAANRQDMAETADELRKKAADAYYDGNKATFRELNRQAAELAQALEAGQ